MNPRFRASAFAMATATLAAPSWAQVAAELAKAAQNPIADMISLPFQNKLRLLLQFLFQK